MIARLKIQKRLKVWEWGEAFRRLGKDVTARPGRYRIASAPYQRAPQESFDDLAAQVTVLYWGKRLGKTEMINNLDGREIHQNPRNILVVYPTLDSAKKWSKQFLMPMIRSTPVLRRLVRDGKQKDSKSTILSKTFPGGSISAIGANSPSGFRQVQAPVVHLDEVDAMIDGPEGDTIELAFGRAENYRDCIQVVSSTATRIVKKMGDGKTEETGSKIHTFWLQSDQQRWFVHNPCCGKWHVLTWGGKDTPGGMKWPKDHPEQAYYECPDCCAHWDDDMRLRAILSGEWRATAPFRGIRGYHLSGLNTTFPAKKGFSNKLHQFAEDFIRAYKRGQSALIVWKNTFLCEPHEESIEKLDTQPLLDRLEDYTPQTIPAQVVMLTCAVDVQDNRLEYEIVGVGEGEETWGIEYGKLIGDTEQDAVWQDLKSTLQRSFKREDGIELRVDRTAIDTRHRGKQVRNFVRTCGIPRVWPVYGVGASTKQSLIVVPHANKIYKLVLFSVNSEAAKDEFFARLKLTKSGPRYVHYPKSYAELGYFEQLTSEDKRIRYTRGYAEAYYHKDPNKRNEAIDLRCYHLAALDILRTDYRRMGGNILERAQQQSAEASKPEEPTKPESGKPTRKRITVGGGGKWI